MSNRRADPARSRIDRLRPDQLSCLQTKRGMLFFPRKCLMLASISEGVLLERARAQGLLSVDDMAAAQKEQGRHQVVRKWGPVLDLLIAQGKISDEAVRKLHASLQEQSPMSLQPALDRTMDGGLEHTMQSEAGVVVMPQVVSAQTYPAPHWDKYEFIETLGRGGMGAVYKARDRRLGRMVALKFIHGDDPAMIQRFLQEARAQARLDHPFICKVYEVGSVDNKPYIAMELVEGRTLDRASAGLDLSQKVQLLKDAAEALHAAHQQGIIHRDVKPSNVTFRRSAATDFPTAIAADGGSTICVHARWERNKRRNIRCRNTCCVLSVDAIPKATVLNRKRSLFFCHAGATLSVDRSAGRYRPDPAASPTPAQNRWR